MHNTKHRKRKRKIKTSMKSLKFLLKKKNFKRVKTFLKVFITVISIVLIRINSENNPNQISTIEISIVAVIYYSEHIT